MQGTDMSWKWPKQFIVKPLWRYFEYVSLLRIKLFYFELTVNRLMYCEEFTWCDDKWLYRFQVKWKHGCLLFCVFSEFTKINDNYLLNGTKWLFYFKYSKNCTCFLPLLITYVQDIFTFVNNVLYLLPLDFFFVTV